MSQIIVGVVFILICLVAILYATKHPLEKYTIERSTSEINNHNESVKRYNYISSQFNTRLASKQTEIISCSDKDAYDKLQYLVKEFNTEIEYAGDYLTRSGTCLGQNDKAGSSFCLKKCNEILDKMADVISAIELIKPKEQYRFKEEKRVVNIYQNEQDIFFSGCKSKEDMDARYKAWCKAYHPDSTGGDAQIFKLMKDTYDELKKGMK